jgi:hypothetical protein
VSFSTFLYIREVVLAFCGYNSDSDISYYSSPHSLPGYLYRTPLKVHKRECYLFFLKATQVSISYLYVFGIFSEESIKIATMIALGMVLEIGNKNCSGEWG